MRKWLFGLLTLALVATPAMAADTWRQAVPGHRYQFPADHASHPAYKTEWWYYTGHLKAGSGERFGYQLTFFRVGLSREAAQPGRSRWRAPDLYVAHFTISDAQQRRQRVFERVERPGLGLAGADTRRYHVWNGTWEGRLEGDRHRLKAAGPAAALSLALTPRKPPVIHGENGISRKADCEGCASHYVSLTRLASEGELVLDGKRYAVEGTSWMDHEWFSNQLGESQRGWDWFSIQLEDGSELMMFYLRDAEGRPVGQSSGTYVRPDGTWRHLPREAFSISPTGEWTSPRSQARYPMGWRVSVPSEQVALTLAPLFEDQELDTKQSTGVAYWEGAVDVTGSHGGRAVKGEGYVEMTGYAKGSRPRI